MDDAFFVASKLAWILIAPDSLLVLLGVAAWLCLLRGWQRLSRSLFSLLTVIMLVLALFPAGAWLLAPLENRFPTNAALPARADGVIALGGAIDADLSAFWGQVELEPSAERITSLIYLAGLYPQAQLVYTGGSGSLSNQEFRDADQAQLLLEQLGFGNRAIVFERQSRNTAENAAFSEALVNPRQEQEWILVTSAYHMPRAVGVFCALNWQVTPYPVDHYTTSGTLLDVGFAFAGNLGLLKVAIREWVGLLAYRFTGRIDELLPGPGSQCQPS